MAVAKGDYYIIDRDERDIGGELVRVATLRTWKSAKQAWSETQPSDDEQVGMFFARVRVMQDGTEGCDTLDCK